MSTPRSGRQMRPRHAMAIVVLAVVTTGSCGGGSSDDGADGQSETQAQTDSAPDTTGDDGVTTSVQRTDETTTSSDGETGQTGQPTEATPREVGTVIAGTAVATVPGTPNEPDQQSGDVTRIDQDCRGRNSLAGLESGAAVTIVDASSGEVVGTGAVERTSAVEISDAQDGGLPVWDCFFHITATLSRTPESIEVQVAGLEPWVITGSIDGFEFSVQGSDGSSTDTAPPDETEPTEPREPSVDTTSETDETEAEVTSPPTT